MCNVVNTALILWTSVHNVWSEYECTLVTRGFSFWLGKSSDLNWGVSMLQVRHLHIQVGVCLFGCGPCHVTRCLLNHSIYSEHLPWTNLYESFMFLSCNFKLIHIIFRGWGQVLENSSKFNNFCSVPPKIAKVQVDLWILPTECPQAWMFQQMESSQKGLGNCKQLHLSAVGFEPTPPYEDQNLSLAP